MPWRETNSMSEKVRFISDYLREEESFAELCEIYTISRKTGYKWVARYESGGIEALEEKSRARLTHQTILPAVEEAILKERENHPLWGPKKLRVVLERKSPELVLPAISTIGEILKRNGMIESRRRRRRSSPHKEPLRSYDAPNSVWCADFKGDFPVGGRRCCPLTISDGYSRYLLSCEALKSSRHHPTKKVFERIFKEFGLPDTIRTDNGAPFSTLAPAGLSRLAVWWIKLGIRPERIKPSRPDQNGRHERMHRTLKAETARPPKTSFPAQQRAFDRFRKEYNEERPHESLKQQVPASIYTPSKRRLPWGLPEIQYPEHYQIQKVYPNGIVSFSGTQWYVSGALSSEWVGLEELSDQRWLVYFAHLPLGIADLRNSRRRKYRNFAHLVPTGRDGGGWHAAQND